MSPADRGVSVPFHQRQGGGERMGLEKNQPKRKGTREPLALWMVVGGFAKSGQESQSRTGKRAGIKSTKIRLI